MTAHRVKIPGPQHGLRLCRLCPTPGLSLTLGLSPWLTPLSSGPLAVPQTGKARSSLRTFHLFFVHLGCAAPGYSSPPIESLQEWCFLRETCFLTFFPKWGSPPTWLSDGVDPCLALFLFIALITPPARSSLTILGPVTCCAPCWNLSQENGDFVGFTAVTALLGTVPDTSQASGNVVEWMT